MVKILVFLGKIPYTLIGKVSLYGALVSSISLLACIALIEAEVNTDHGLLNELCFSSMYD